MSTNRKIVGCRFKRYDGVYLNYMGYAISKDVSIARVFIRPVAEMLIKTNNLFHKQRGKWELVYE